MPLTQVQRQTSVSAANVASLTATFSPAATAGNLLSCNGNSDSTLAMTSTGWSLAWSNINNTGLYQWYKIAAGGETTVVITPGGGSFSTEMVIREYSGNAASSPLDKTASGSVGSGATGTTAATTQADELAIAGLGGNNTASSHAASWSLSFVTEINIIGLGSTPTELHTSTKALSATGTVTTTGTTAETISGAGVGTYKAATGGGVTVKQFAALGVG